MDSNHNSDYGSSNIHIYTEKKKKSRDEKNQQRHMTQL